MPAAPALTLPSDPASRLARAELALLGLSVGDAFGQRYFTHPLHVDRLIAQRALAPAPWGYTDDTEMALAVTDVLTRHARVDRDALARAFARRYTRDPMRGYGGTAHDILQQIHTGIPWRDAASAPFDGAGSMGNGGAMRAAPVGAYFADDLPTLVAEARASAEVTHAHPEGQAGAIASALAAAYAVRARHAPDTVRDTTLLAFVIEHTPPGPTRDGLVRAQSLPADTTPHDAAHALGNGSRVISEDTVPFALFFAQRHLADYEEALWATVAGLGDRDTTCAIVGGIVVMYTGSEGVPADWLAAREPLARDVDLTLP